MKKISKIDGESERRVFVWKLRHLEVIMEGERQMRMERNEEKMITFWDKAEQNRQGGW